MDDGIVINAVTRETFLSGVEKALTMTSAELIRKRKEAAKLNSWSERVNSIAEFLSGVNMKMSQEL